MDALSEVRHILKPHRLICIGDCRTHRRVE
ncbi:unnamed protein product [Ectocarpus sp. CCAP 1310/34]|nr:unnamed protein product [Ectocarpus sp. CCAP 1310/34]